MTFTSQVPRSLTALLFSLFVFSTNLIAATEVLSNVNIVNEKEKNAIILLTGNDPETFPYDQAYGLTNYWTKWDVILNDDNTYSFHLNGKYLSANDSDGIDVASSIGTKEKFVLESGNGSYYLRTWRFTYVGASGSGWKDLVQSYERTSNEEWLFFERPDPTTGLDNVNMSNYYYKTIIILLTGNDPETFPYDQAYGANNYWTKWDVIANSDGTYSFHLNGKYLASASGSDLVVVSSITSAAKFTMSDAGRGSYFLISNDSRYMTATGSGWLDVELSSTVSDAARWHFFDRQDVTIYDDALFQDADTVSNVNENVSSVDFVETFTNIPTLFAAMQTTSGTDPAAVRITGVDENGFDLFIEEEQSNDTELDHNNEYVGFMAFEEGAIRNTSGAIIGETGTLNVTQDSGGTWFTFDDFIGDYSNPVVIMNIVSFNGSHAAHIRIKSVGTTSFKYQVEEWDYLDGGHVTESVNYMIVEKGTHDLERGGTLQATSQKIDHDWEVINFPSAHASTPIVLSQSQTTNGSSSIVTRQKSINTTSVTAKLQEQEADNGTHDNEWVAVVSYDEN